MGADAICTGHLKCNYQTNTPVTCHLIILFPHPVVFLYLWLCFRNQDFKQFKDETVWGLEDNYTVSFLNQSSFYLCIHLQIENWVVSFKEYLTTTTEKIVTVPQQPTVKSTGPWWIFSQHQDRKMKCLREQAHIPRWNTDVLRAL